MNTSLSRIRRLSVGFAVVTFVAVSAVGSSGDALSPPVVAVRPALDESDIDDAKRGISLFLIDNIGSVDAGITAPCPLMAPDQYGWFMGQQALAPNLTTWFVDLSYYDIGDGVPGAICGADIEAHLDQPIAATPHAGQIEASTLPSDVTFDQFIADIDRAVRIGPGAPEIGGDIGGVCYRAEQAICIMMWHRSGLVISSVVVGPAADIPDTKAIALLNSMVSTVVESLITYANAPAPGAPTTVAAPVPPPPTTVPAATAAPTVPAVTVPAATLTVPAPTTPLPTVPVTTLPLPTVPPQTAPPATVPLSTVPPLVAPTVPGAVTTTTTGLVPSTVPVTPVGTLDLAGARATLADFIANNPVGTDVLAGAGTTPACPASDPAGIGQVMTSVGLVPNMNDFRITVDAATAAPGLTVVACGGDVIGALFDAEAATPSHTPLLTMYDINAVATLDQVLAERTGVTQLQANVPTIGGDIYGGGCETVEDLGSFCVRIWHREGFIVTLEVGGTGQPGLGDATTDALVTLVPQVIDDLATHATWPPPTGPT